MENQEYSDSNEKWACYIPAKLSLKTKLSPGYLFGSHMKFHAAYKSRITAFICLKKANTKYLDSVFSLLQMCVHKLGSVKNTIDIQLIVNKINGWIGKALDAERFDVFVIIHKMLSPIQSLNPEYVCLARAHTKCQRENNSQQNDKIVKVRALEHTHTHRGISWWPPCNEHRIYSRPNGYMDEKTHTTIYTIH